MKTNFLKSTLEADKIKTVLDATEQECLKQSTKGSDSLLHFILILQDSVNQLIQDLENAEYE